MKLFIAFKEIEFDNLNQPLLKPGMECNEYLALNLVPELLYAIKFVRLDFSSNLIENVCTNNTFRQYSFVSNFSLFVLLLFFGYLLFGV